MDEDQGEDYNDIPKTGMSQQNFAKKLNSEMDSNDGESRLNMVNKMNEIRSIEPPEDANQIELQRRIIAKTKTDKSHPLAKKNTYDSVGTNGFFTAMPSVIKFAGFETNKTHTIKLRILNNSPAPQRLHILPPQTSYFKIRYNKKGMLPTGVAEDIYVQFTPAPDQYTYYYDSVRIHCEGDKLLVPIHAFPVINSKQPELFPSVIDMGIGCVVGKTYQKQLQIESNCPVSFEYNIEVLQPHPDIAVFPLMGDILGM